MNESNKCLLDWWINNDAIEQTKLDYLCTPNTFKPISQDLYFDTLTQCYFDEMPGCNLNVKSSHLRFLESATSFINQLFEYYVDDETLVVSSITEHPSVNINLANYDENIFLYTDFDLRMNNVKRGFDTILKYKKVFVYIIGTHTKDSFSTYQTFFIKLKQFCLLHNIKCIIVIDAVQELFLLPRDYSIFDYVIGTAHAIIRSFDMGILIINHDNKVFGEKYYNWGITYLHMLKEILKRRNKLFLFRHVMTSYYSSLLTNESDLIIEDTHNCAGYFFHLTDKCGKFSPDIRNKLKEYEIEFDNNEVIRLRGQIYLQKPDLLINGVKLLDKLIKEMGIENE